MRNNSPITDSEQASLRADFASIRETLNTSVAGFLHLPHDRATFDDSKEERWAFYEKMWSSPGFSKLFTQSRFPPRSYFAIPSGGFCPAAALPRHSTPKVTMPPLRTKRRKRLPRICNNKKPGREAGLFAAHPSVVLANARTHNHRP